VAVERIPAGSGVLAHITGGAPRISDARAMAIARKAGVTSGAKSASAVHVMLSSDVSRPTNPLAGTGAVSAWMVTFHGVKLPKNGTTAGETGSSTVFLNAETGKVIRVLNYVPTPVN